MGQHLVNRNGIEIPRNQRQRQDRQAPESAPLANFRETYAYALLGDPGSGKTTAFRQEAEKLGEQDALYLSARDFLGPNKTSSPVYKGKVLFIDGLDEIRFANTDKRSVASETRERLNHLDNPRFRLSCRQADWLRKTDFSDLEDAVPQGQELKLIRLLPLSDEDIHEILERGHPEKADEILQLAKETGLDGILHNPQNLDFFTRSIALEERPQNRFQIFEYASANLAHELNEDRQQGYPADWKQEQILDAAGCRCTAFLISAPPHLPHFPSVEERKFPCPEENLSHGDWEKYLSHALETRLFHSVAEEKWAPIHRHVAEFLSARYLAKLIKKGLSVRRLLSLISEQGTVVTELRCLSAWLAVHSPEARSQIIDKDPVGVALYGDLSDFSDGEKTRMLDALCVEGTRDIHSIWYSANMAAFQGLATPSNESIFQRILQKDDRSSKHRELVIMVLRVLQHGTPLVGLRPTIKRVIYDRTWDSTVNYRAVKALFCADSGREQFSELPEDLKEIQEGVQSGAIPDSDHEISGLLLEHMYPDMIAPDEIWNHLHKTNNLDYCRFWDHTLLEKSGDEEVRQLLDTWVERSSELMPVILENHWGIILADLLARGLSAHGEKIAINKLYNWLATCTQYNHSFVQSLPEDTAKVRDWLTCHPEIQKKIILEGVSRCTDTERVKIHIHDVNHLLDGVDRPQDYVSWCLQQAVEEKHSPEIAKYFLHQAVSIAICHPQASDLSMETLEKHVTEHEPLQEEYREISSRLRDTTGGNFRESRRYLLRDREIILALRGDITRQKDAIRENRADWSLLNNIVRVGQWQSALGPYSLDRCEGAISAKYLNKLLGGDADLGKLVQNALYRAIDRDDLPSAKEISQKSRQNLQYPESLPVLAGLMEYTSDELQQLAPDQVQTALAFCFITPINGCENLLDAFAETHPEITTRTLVQYPGIAMKSGSDSILKSYPDKFLQTIREAYLPLLEAFPKTCRNEQVSVLACFLRVAIVSNASGLGRLIDRKLRLKRMQVAQRTCWLGAGLSVKPESYAESMSNFLRSRGKETRIRYLVGFFQRTENFIAEATNQQKNSNQNFCLLPELLIQHVGRLYAPWSWASDREYAQYPYEGIQASQLIEGCIHVLASSHTPEANKTLKDLLENKELSKWHTHLRHAFNEQQVLYRDACYQRPGIDKLAQTLAREAPANVGDLMAILVDVIDDLAIRMRSDSADLWRAYWNETSNGRPTDSKPENSCRDALRSQLDGYPEVKRAKINLYREYSHARMTRSDLCAVCGEFCVPIEIKMSHRPKVGSALHSQLIKKYACDYSAKGHGIYLVLWTGEECQGEKDCTVAGKRPQTADEMQQLLEGQLSALDRDKITVRVLDVRDPRNA